MLTFRLMLLAAALSLQGTEEGFRNLWDGRDLAGWKFYAKKAPKKLEEAVRVEGGVLSFAGKPLGYLYTEEKFKNFTLRLEWRFERPALMPYQCATCGKKSPSSASPPECHGKPMVERWKGNSGVLVWIDPSGHDVWPRALEVQLMHQEEGSILFFESTGRFVYRPTGPKAPGEWNAAEIVARTEGTTVVSINGKVTATVTQHEFKDAGTIGLQSEGFPIQWRNIRIKEEK